MGYFLHDWIQLIPYLRYCFRMVLPKRCTFLQLPQKILWQTCWISLQWFLPLSFDRLHKTSLHSAGSRSRSEPFRSCLLHQKMLRLPLLAVHWQTFWFAQRWCLYLDQHGWWSILHFSVGCCCFEVEEPRCLRSLICPANRTFRFI